MSKYKTCCFTGHRKIPTNEFYTIYEQTKNQIETLVQNGYDNFIAGGALGFDTLAATAVINVKKRISTDSSHSSFALQRTNEVLE